MNLAPRYLSTKDAAAYLALPKSSRAADIVELTGVAPVTFRNQQRFSRALLDQWADRVDGLDDMTGPGGMYSKAALLDRLTPGANQ